MVSLTRSPFHTLTTSIQCGAATWAVCNYRCQMNVSQHIIQTRNRKDFALQGTRPKACDSVVRSVGNSWPAFLFISIVAQVRRVSTAGDQFPFPLLEMVLRVRKARAEDIHQHFGDGRRGRRIPGDITRSAFFKGCILFLTTVRSDEVESLTAARAGAVDGREPSDALRVCERASCIIYIHPLRGCQRLAHTIG